MPEGKRQEILKAAGDAVRAAAKEGSKMEKFLYEALTNAGFVIEYHVEGRVPNVRLEIDLFAPELGVAIEIDGPSHFLPIWGEESLKKNIDADMNKTGLLLAAGFVIIRIKQLSNTVSKKGQRDILESLIKELNGISHQFPEEGKRLIELEV
jgi:very-short-patch-repair endonuclease